MTRTFQAGMAEPSECGCTLGSGTKYPRGQCDDSSQGPQLTMGGCWKASNLGATRGGHLPSNGWLWLVFIDQRGSG